MHALNEAEEIEALGIPLKSLEDADYVLELISDLRRQVAENGRVEAAGIARLKARTELLNAPLERRAAHLESELRAWAEANRPALLSGKAKSRKLHHGSIGWRRSGGGLSVIDPAALLAWAKAHRTSGTIVLVRTKEEPGMAEIKKLCAATGEIPDGTEPLPERDEFFCKVDEFMATTKEEA